MTIVPYKNVEDSKKDQVRQMFDNIAPKYDFLNHFLSVGIDKQWRKKVCQVVAEKKTKYVMDMASGTGDLAIGLSRHGAEKVVGIDISEKMLEIAQKKVQAKGLDEKIIFKVGDAENLEDCKDTFDAVTCAFGVRNFENIEKGLSEFYRVLKPQGRLVILELSIPENPLIRFGYNTYFHYILPLWGRFFSKDSAAYNYLPESVSCFPKKNVFIALLESVGFKDCRAQLLTLGVATIFVAEK